MIITKYNGDILEIEEISLDNCNLLSTAERLIRDCFDLYENKSKLFGNLLLAYNLLYMEFISKWGGNTPCIYNDDIRNMLEYTNNFKQSNPRVVQELLIPLDCMISYADVMSPSFNDLTTTHITDIISRSLDALLKLNIINTNYNRFNLDVFICNDYIDEDYICIVELLEPEDFKCKNIYDNVLERIKSKILKGKQLVKRDIRLFKGEVLKYTFYSYCRDLFDNGIRELPVFINDPEVFIDKVNNSDYHKYLQNTTMALIRLFNTEDLINNLDSEDIIKFIGGRISELPRKI